MYLIYYVGILFTPEQQITQQLKGQFSTIFPIYLIKRKEKKEKQKEKQDQLPKCCM